MDIEEQEDFERYDNASQILLEYFSQDNVDFTKLDEMLKLYDKFFYNINKSLLVPKYYDEIIERFNLISRAIVKVLSNIDFETNKSIGQELLQKTLSEKKNLGKQPSLLQYFFYDQCNKNSIPYQPMESFFDIKNGAMACYPSNIVKITSRLGKKYDDLNESNIFVLYAILHELEHLKHRFANPNGNYNQKLFGLLNKIQSLEDGFETGNPSHNIGQHTEFPDEIFADVGACKILYDELKNNYIIDNESFLKMQEFLKMLASKLLIKNGENKDNLPTPTEYLKKFVQERIIDNSRLSKTEMERVKQFTELYVSLVPLMTESERVF